MTNYEELIEELKNTRHLDPLREVCADAIEQLVKSNKRLRQIRNSYQHKIKKYQRDIKRIIKERDEANIRTEHKCDTCKNNFKWERKGA